MKKKKPISRSTVAAKRNSKRRAKSCFLVVIFMVVFACMLLTEVFYVEEEKWREERFLSNFGEVSLPPLPSSRFARELRVEQPPPFSNFSIDSHLPPSDDTWQRVSQTKDKFFVYSAYYDDRRSKWVRVVAAARTRLADKVFCRFSYKEGSKAESFEVSGINRLIRENWNLKYSAYFILCPLRETNHRVPHYVSILKQGGTQAGNRLVIRDNRERFRKLGEIAVCIKPLHYEYNKVQNLVEFVELNRILGVDHFVLYNHTVGREVNCILRKYASEGIVTVLQWQLDMLSQKEIRTEGLFAALNDCLYRTMFRFRYVLMIDLDEYIVPHRDSSLARMLERLVRTDRTGALSFQNAFFYLQWPEDAQSQTLPYRLLTLQKTIRKSKLHAHKQRSKCIVLPDHVVEMGNHFVWEFLAGKTMVNVPPDSGFLHHYRVCEFGGNDCVNTSHVVDRRTYTWRDPLVEAVDSRLKILQPVCPNVLFNIRE